MSAIQSESDPEILRYSFFNVVSCPPAQRAHEQAGARGGYKNYTKRSRYIRRYVPTNDGVISTPRPDGPWDQTK
jgi:hypothetical protein